MKDFIVMIVSVFLYTGLGILMEDVLKVKEYWKYGLVFYLLGMITGIIKGRFL